MDFNTACPSGNLMVHAEDNAPDVTPSGECCECGRSYGEHQCVMCLDEITSEVCMEYSGHCKRCYEEERNA